MWEGVVSIFAIKGHDKADKAYAWSFPIEGSTKRRFYAVLNIPPIDSPEKAVRASIVHDSKRGKWKMSEDEQIEFALKDPRNWITRKCCICGEPVRINKILDRIIADPKEPFTCKKCLFKE